MGQSTKRIYETQFHKTMSNLNPTVYLGVLPVSAPKSYAGFHNHCRVDIDKILFRSESLQWKALDDEPKKKAGTLRIYKRDHGVGRQKIIFMYEKSFGRRVVQYVISLMM